MPGIIPPGGAGGIGPSGNPQVYFANSVAKQTGLDPRVVYAWTVVEGATAPNGTGHFNFLNLRPFPGDPSYGQSPGGFEQFSTVDKAVAATVRRLRQPFATSIVSSAGRTPATQFNAIAASGWDQNHYAGDFGGQTTRGGSLFATFAKLYGSKPLGGDASSSSLPAAGGGSTGGDGLLSGIGGALGGLGGGLEAGALRVGLYLIFTLAAFGFIFLALDRAGGGAPHRAIGSLGRATAESGIPF